MIYDKLKLPEATAKGYAECPVGCVCDGSFLWVHPQRRRARVQWHDGINVTGALQCSGSQYLYYEGIEL